MSEKFTPPAPAPRQMQSVPSSQYPRPFVCGNPSCEKLLGVIHRDNQGIVSLYVLREIRPCGTEIMDLDLVRADFSVMRMGYGDIPCTCGHETTWHWNNQLLSRLIKRK